MATKKELKDKTTGHLNSTAPAINYPKGKAPQTPENPSGDGKPKTKKETREIEFHFSDKEIQDKGIKLAKTLQEKHKIEEEKKAIADEFKMKIDAKQSEIDAITEQITNGFETRTVTVEVRRNFDTGMREYWYKDIKRGQEPLTAQDHQLELDMAEESAEKNRPEFDLKLAAGDFVVTKKGVVVEITEEDVINGIQYKSIDRLATQEEIDKATKKKS